MLRGSTAGRSHLTAKMIRPDALVALSALHPDPSAKVMQA